ncbi:MAG: hypothetical protein ACMG57_01840 [Candidatus Dojkabacteria bacterium]
MRKILRIAFTIIAAFFLAFFMLSFPSKPGVDCVAGCTQGIGFPFDAYTISSGGISSSERSVVGILFPSLTRIGQVYTLGFIADLFILGILLTLIYKFLDWLDRKLF